jgi:hypothetical protein
MVFKWVFNIRVVGLMDFMDIHQQTFQELVFRPASDEFHGTLWWLRWDLTNKDWGMNGIALQ